MMRVFRRVREFNDRLEDGYVLPSLSICLLFAMAFAVASLGG
jgi:hypothetical protein